MKNKIFGILAVLIFGLMAFMSGMYAIAGSAFTSYDNAMRTDKPAVILFYADWCAYCRRFMPKFNTVAGKNSDKFSFVKINVDSSDKNRMISNKYGIKSLPTVYIVNPRNKSKKPISPTAYNSVNSFQDALNTYYNYRR